MCRCFRGFFKKCFSNRLPLASEVQSSSRDRFSCLLSSDHLLLSEVKQRVAGIPGTLRFKEHVFPGPGDFEQSSRLFTFSFVGTFQHKQFIHSTAPMTCLNKTLLHSPQMSYSVREIIGFWQVCSIVLLNSFLQKQLNSWLYKCDSHKKRQIDTGPSCRWVFLDLISCCLQRWGKY